MKLIKRIIASALVLCTAISLTACSDTTWAYDYSGKKITSGLYIAKQMEAFSEAQTHKDIKEKVSFFDQVLDGKKANVWVNDEAKAKCDQFMAIENKFDELGLTFTEKDNNIIDQSVKTSWEGGLGKLYEQNSVSEDTFRMLIANGQKKELIFNKYYDKGGIEEVKTEDLLVHFKENFANINMVGIPISVAEEGKELTAEQQAENDEALENAKGFVDAINKDKKAFNVASDEYNHKANNDTHDASDKDDVIKPDSESTTVINKNQTVPSKKVVDAIFNDAKVEGDAMLIEDTNTLYVLKRYDIAKATKDFDEMRTELLGDLKTEDFAKMAKTWGEELGKTAKANENSIKRYKPKNIDFSQE